MAAPRKTAAKKAAAKKDPAPKANQASAEASDRKRKPEKVTVHLVDPGEQTAWDAKRLVHQFEGSVVSETKGKFVVELPLGSDRDPSAVRNKLINGLATSPLITKVESA